LGWGGYARPAITSGVLVLAFNIYTEQRWLAVKKKKKTINAYNLHEISRCTPRDAYFNPDQ